MVLNYIRLQQRLRRRSSYCCEHGARFWKAAAPTDPRSSDSSCSDSSTVSSSSICICTGTGCGGGLGAVGECRRDSGIHHRYAAGAGGGASPAAAERPAHHRMKLWCCFTMGMENQHTFNAIVMSSYILVSYFLIYHRIIHEYKELLSRDGIPTRQWNN